MVTTFAQRIFRRRDTTVYKQRFGGKRLARTVINRGIGLTRRGSKGNNGSASDDAKQPSIVTMEVIPGYTGKVYNSTAK